MSGSNIDNEDITLVRGETLSIDAYLTLDTGEPLDTTIVPLDKMKAEAWFQNNQRIPLLIEKLEEEGCYRLSSDIDTSKIVGDSFLVNVGVKDIPNSTDGITIAAFNKTFYVINSASDISSFNHPPVVSVILLDSDNSVMRIVKVLQGESFNELIYRPVKEGYTFLAWTPAMVMPVTENASYKATYTVNSHTVTFILDDVVYQTDTYNYGETITYPNINTAGHTFSGWSETPATMPDEDIVIYGSNPINEHHITFYLDGVEWYQKQYKYGQTVEPMEPSHRQGYQFNGWSPALPATMPDNNLTVNGTYSQVSHSVKYYVDDDLVHTDHYHYGDAIVPHTVTKTGSRFVQWDGLPYYMLDSDIEAHAVFETGKFKLTYILNGSSTPYHEELHEYNDNITLFAAPSMEGYTFSGWQGFPSNNKMPANDVIVTGTTTGRLFTITYKSELGVTLGTRQVPCGSIPPDVPEYITPKDKYAFMGWEGLEIPMPARNLTVTASYSQMFTDYWVVGLDAVLWAMEDGRMLLEGTGATFDYDGQTRPWQAYLEDGRCKTIEISEGITSIGKYLFYRDSANITEYMAESISIPDTVASIYDYAFYDCGFKNIDIYGDPDLYMYAFGRSSYSAADTYNLEKIYFHSMGYCASKDTGGARMFANSRNVTAYYLEGSGFDTPSSAAATRRSQMSKAEDNWTWVIFEEEDNE